MTESGRDRPHHDDPLSSVHSHMLAVASGISPAVIAARGYRSVTVKTRLRELGFSAAQCLTPGLLLPVWNISGEIATYQFRPDQPRISPQGKPVKYETRQGSTMVLDVSPLIRERVMDPRVPLLITEGIRKADAAISHGGCCVALLGVWNWRGKDQHGTTRMLPEFERIPLRDRAVSLVFDSDLLEKSSVAQALIRLGRALQDSFKADVRVARIPVVPHVPSAESQGERV
jgi:hypothetical protein